MDGPDPAAVRRYFDAVGASAAAAGYMAHERKLPPAAAHYRKQRELALLADWLGALPPTARVLDVGCGAGNWTEVLAARYARVLGVDWSAAMLAAARARLAAWPNVELLQGDVTRALPDGPFELIFVGGVCMYLGDDEVARLLGELRARLGGAGLLLLRESTVRRGRRLARGRYQAVYRTVAAYEDCCARAGLRVVATRLNRGYESFEMAADLADLVPGPSGAAVWSLLRAGAPLVFGALPRLLALARVPWPRLQNHFFRLARADQALQQ